MTELLAATDLRILGDPDAERSDDEWAALLLILLANQDRARRSWRLYGPPQFAGLVDATAYETVADIPDAPPVWWFLTLRQRYGIASRRMVPDGTVRAAFDQYTAGVAEQVRSNTTALTTGAITLLQWQQVTRDLLIDEQLVAAAVARGGVSRVNEEDRQRLAVALAFQFVRNGVFARALADGQYADADPVLRRALQYVADASQQYQATRRVSHIDAGFLFEANVLDEAAEHCVGGTDETPDCPTVTAVGWARIGQLPAIGARLCKWNCRCRWAFTRTDDVPVPTV
jgi:hypothetical protein